MQFSVGQRRKLTGKATFEQRFEGSERKNQASVWEHRWAVKNGGQSGWGGMSEGTGAENEVTEVARLGERRGRGARLSGAH